MRKLKKLAFLLLLIILLVPIMLTVIHKVKQNKIYEYCQLPENTKNCFYISSFKTLLIGLENDDIWEVGKDGSKYIASDICYIADDSSYISNFFMIEDDGDIYDYANDSYRGRKIGNIDGAISGTIKGVPPEECIFIVTEEGDLYVKGANQLGVLGVGDIEYVDEFTKVEGIPQVKKVVSGRNYTLLLTLDGTVYYSGYYYGQKQSKFEKCQSDFYYTDIAIGRWCNYAMDDKGNVYIIEVYDRDGVFLLSNKENMYKNVVSMKTSGSFAAFLSDTGKIYYSGEYFRGKAVDSFEAKPFTFSGTEEILLQFNELYLIKDGVVYLKDLSR